MPCAIIKDGDTEIIRIGDAISPAEKDAAMRAVEIAERFMARPCGIAFGNCAVFIEDGRLDDARRLVSEKDAAKAALLPPDPENCAIIAVSTFMQIMGGQEDGGRAMTMSPMSRLKEGGLLVPAIQPSVFGMLMREARKKKRGKKAVVAAACLDEAHEKRVKEMRRKFEAMAKEEREHMKELAHAVAETARPLLVSVGMLEDEAVAINAEGVPERPLEAVGVPVMKNST